MLITTKPTPPKPDIATPKIGEAPKTLPDSLSAKPAENTATKPVEVKVPMVSLKAICSELKLDPRLAREKLRIAVREGKKFPELVKARKPRSPWEWPKGTQAEKEARAALAE